jgi:hypothetical protein
MYYMTFTVGSLAALIRAACTPFLAPVSFTSLNFLDDGSSKHL